MTSKRATLGVRHRDAALESGDTSPQSKWRPYPKYKDSGVEWLGEIPAHWKFKRLKFLVSEPLAYGANEAAEIIDPELPRFIRITDIRDDGRLRDDTFRSLPREIAIPYLLKDGDLLFARSGATVGKTFRYNPGWGIAAHAGYLIRARLDKYRIDSHFVHYFTQSDSYWNWIRSSLIQATIQNVSAERYSNLVIPVPVLDIQLSIVSFLDRETGKIDALIEKKERLIELLQEKRTALITQAVTKGLNPTVPMKDSGIEWLGKIPAHWDLLPLKCCVLPKAGSIKTGPFGSQLLAADMQGEDVKVYNQRTVIDRDFLKGDVFISRQKFQELKAFEIYPGDVLVTTRGTIGRCAIVPADSDQGILHPCLMRIQPDPAQLIREFITLLIQESYLVKTQLALASNATTIDVIYSDTIGRVLVPKPPISEQAAIIKWIDERVVEIHRLDEMVLEAFERLKEYRTALISAAVSGKIDVRGEVAQ